MNHYLKWGLYVALSLPVSLILALEFMRTIPTVLAVVSGIILFVFFYAYFDKYLLNTNKVKARMALKIGVISCSILLIYPALPMLAGGLALETSGQILNIDSFRVKQLSFFAVFLTTVIDGFLLSFIVAILAIFARVLLIFKDVTEENDNDK